MSQNSNNQFINNHFYQTKKLLDDLSYLLKNRKAASSYFKPARMIGLKIAGFGIVFLIINIIALIYPNYLSLFPEYFLGVLILPSISILGPVYIIKVVASLSTTRKQDKLKKFIDKNSFHKDLPTPVTINNTYFESYNKELSVGLYNRIESYLLNGKDLYHQDYFKRERFFLLKKVFFLPITNFRSSNIAKKITSFAFLIIGSIYIKLYKRFEKTTLFIFYFILQTAGDNSDKKQLTKGSTEQKRSTPFELAKNELTQGLKKGYYPIWADGTDKRKTWSEYIKAWLYKSWEIMLKNDSNKSDNQKKRDILDEFQKEFGALTDNKAPGISTIERTYEKYKGEK